MPYPRLTVHLEMFSKTRRHVVEVGAGSREGERESIEFPRKLNCSSIYRQRLVQLHFLLALCPRSLHTLV